MKNPLSISLVALLLAALPARADIVAREVETAYPVSGATGAALYASIGERGPNIRDGAARAIAHTVFDLKWHRDYEPDGSACVLAAAKPFLTITTTLPKPAQTLPPDVAARWRVFIAGIRAHEAVHGEFIRDMARDIAAATIGFRQENDPGCKQIRKAVVAPIQAAFDRYKARNAAFEQAEMAPGGPVRRLILDLVN
ncbi:MAG: DUF922 domain-containing protein [Oricola sp.]